jgi:transposase
MSTLMRGPYLINRNLKEAKILLRVQNFVISNKNNHNQVLVYEVKEDDSLISLFLKKLLPKMNLKIKE